jgi:hypothetical protein
MGGDPCFFPPTNPNPDFIRFCAKRLRKFTTKKLKFWRETDKVRKTIFFYFLGFVTDRVKFVLRKPRWKHRISPTLSPKDFISRDTSIQSTELKIFFDMKHSFDSFRTIKSQK